MLTEVDYDTINGKTVRAVARKYDRMVIVFEDGTFLHLYADKDYVNDAHLDGCTGFKWPDFEDDEEMIRVGMTTKQEADDFRKSVELSRSNAIDAANRRRYEELCNKYGIEPVPFKEP